MLSNPTYDSRVAHDDEPEVYALRDKDPGAIRAVVDAHARRLYRAARGLGLGESDAQDLVQEVFVTFLATLDRFEGRSSIGTWLFGILHHKAREHWRARGREELTADDSTFEARFDQHGSWRHPPPEVDRLLESRQAEASLRRCLDDLPSQQREVFHFRLVEEWGAAETASAIGCTVNHVGVLLHRARLRLRQCLEAMGVGPGR